ncbi:sulfate adenylyltransferase subunit 2 [Anaerosporobacter mobilis DSM 15930]|uniref:Sulfate adenylyltransferase subunit 2 n=1 Tax=Anaerosporobacter mobilis DSM 15930 TaxID=1120996 RepID=A0A1M7I7U2_9FIRM|nr:sulfate adenylyltransferase subunit CysD [Anaerosporobacter mobilis]SHM36689.1 sulfate adenylyltransferase subunit 2 [Anaerosporobacter mobilis DSM 15930]
MDEIKALEDESIYLIREAYNKFKNIAMLWSIGKDSTTMLWLVRKAFFGKIPFPVIHIDTGYKFKEIYEFRDRYAKEWDLDLIVYKNQEALDLGICPEKGRFECCNQLKTMALKKVIMEKKLEAVLLGIRRDEHGIRAKERVFSVRDEDFEWNYKEQSPEIWKQYRTGIQEKEHIRVHPILGWTELDIWKYIKRENIPITDLYFAKENKRYRSIGCETCCSSLDSEADTVEKIIQELETTNISERSGRVQDKESDYMMQKLRSLGYM